jgi:hypothetical protein
LYRYAIICKDAHGEHKIKDPAVPNALIRSFLRAAPRWDGAGLFHWAVVEGRLDWIRLFYEVYGMNINAKVDGRTAFDLAIRYKKYEIAYYFLGLGVEIKEKEDCLAYLIQDGLLDWIEYLHKEEMISIQACVGDETAVDVAIRNQKWKIATWLYGNGVPIGNGKDLEAHMQDGGQEALEFGRYVLLFLHHHVVEE